MPAYLMDVDFEEFTRLFRDVEFHLPLPSKWLSLMVMNLESPPTCANLGARHKGSVPDRCNGCLSQSASESIN